MKIAIIDLGTNSARLFIYKQNKRGRFRKIVKKKSMVRLGDGLFDTGTLSTTAIKRTIETLLEFNEIIAVHQPELIRAIATSALRVSPDPQLIINPVQEATGIALEVISGEEEARLIAVGVLNTLKLSQDRFSLIDIGGGSTEVSVIEKNEILVAKSLELGAGRNQQTFLCSVPPVRNSKYKGINALRAHVQQTLTEQIPPDVILATPTIIGTSGSVRAFRRIANAQGLQGTTFSRDFLTDTIETLKGKTRKEILSQFPTLEPRRADLILAAGIILDEVCSFFSVDTIRVTSCSLKDGVLANLQLRYHL